MLSTIFTIVMAFCGLGFGWAAIYVGVNWWQDFIPEVEALNFLFLIIFAAIGLLCVCVGVTMLWDAIKKVLFQPEIQEPSKETLPPFEV